MRRPMETCPRCGQVHERCVAHRGDGKPCMRWPLKGGAVCKKHGGGSPQVIAAARRRLASAEAVRRLQDVDIVPIGDPLDALADLAARAQAWMLQMADMVNELSEYRFTSKEGAEHLDARVALLERAMDRLQKYLSDWVRLGFEDRKVRVDEVRAGLMAVFVAGVLRGHGIDPESPGSLEILDRWLPVLDGAPAPIDVKET